MIPRMLIFRDTPLETYRNYLMGGGDFHPVLTALNADGAVTDTIRFRIEAGRAPRDLELLAVSPDSAGRNYEPHPLGDAVWVRGDTLIVDLRKHRDRFFGPDRNVISYALVSRSGGSVRYHSRGVMHWLKDPSTGPVLRP